MILVLSKKFVRNNISNLESIEEKIYSLKLDLENVIEIFKNKVWL